LVGVSPDEWQTDFSGVNVYNHDWSDSEAFVSLGTISSEEIEEISEGMLAEEVEVRINRKVVEYDQVIICGPVFPHEVVGFSGGNKYFFPGVSGPEIIDLSHWLGALITNYEIIGTTGVTPVRKLIDRAASMIQRPKLCFAMVVEPGGEDLMGLYIDVPERAWEAAAELSSRVHVNYVDKPLQRVLSVMPKSYDDMWTAAKGMYKMEPAVEDGGEVIIFAPHITEFSRTHGEQLAEIGYHVRDYFLKRWDEFKDYPGTVLAHSTHLKGTGSYDEETGRETPRVNVTLATGISEERCRQHNLGYLDPDQVNLGDWPEKPEGGSLMVPKAGEILYRLHFSRE
jgi:nickel-dependent lactate racemase